VFLALAQGLSEAISAAIDDADRFENGKQIGSYFGLTPRRYQSGSTDRQGKISGCGNKLVRSMLQYSVPRSVRIRSSLMSCSSKNGTTYSFKMSAATRHSVVVSFAKGHLGIGVDNVC